MSRVVEEEVVDKSDGEAGTHKLAVVEDLVGGAGLQSVAGVVEVVQVCDTDVCPLLRVRNEPTLCRDPRLRRTKETDNFAGR